jgi:aryl-alcohol dehydrogenase-like predicted oxidoreductase
VFATAEGTARYVARYPEFRDAGFYRTVLGLQVSSLGIGTYLKSSVDSVLKSVENGINFVDSAINYGHFQAEKDVGEALKHLQRDEIVVCTKAGFLTPGGIPDFLQPGDVVGGMHSMEPRFLADQLDRSRTNLGIETIDVFYLHNPETQLGFRTRDQFDANIARAFSELERQVERGAIRSYGVATWDGLRKSDGLSLPRLAELAGPHFRFVQLPFNLAMVEAYIDPRESVLAAAARLGIAVVASATLAQTRVINNMPDTVRELLPGLATDAQRAIQFTRSTPGISVALVGMGNPAHVEENIGVARVPPTPLETYRRFYR